MSGPPAPAAPSTPTPRPPPGAKRARHLRWTRVTRVATVVVLAAFAVGLAVVVYGWISSGTPAERRVEGERRFLAGIASEIENYRSLRGRLPRTLAELREPSLPSMYDAQPWDSWKRPIEYAPAEDGASFRLRSVGPDGRPDTADDIVWPAGEPWNAVR